MKSQVKGRRKRITVKCARRTTMITIQDLYNIMDNKIANEAQKALIRNNFPPQIADRMCAAIDGHEKAELFKRILNEYNEWLVNQQRQQMCIFV